MVRRRHSQRNLGEVFFAREAESLMGAWMKETDEILEDEQLLDLVYEQLGQRHPQSRKRGRNSTPSEVVLRWMVLKHVRNWSYEVLEREVKANLVYRMFTRIGTETLPDAKTLGKLGRALGEQNRGADSSAPRGEEGMERWVGFGVVADAFINRGRVWASRRNG